MKSHPSRHALAFTILAVACLTVPSGSPRSPEPEVVVVPTLGTDHQFDLDYSVAHVAAMLDAVAPDALVIADFTDWLRAGCIYQASAPEHHVAMEYAREKRISIWGTRTRPSAAAFDVARQAARRLNDRYPSTDAVERDYRPALEQMTARLAREFSFSENPQTLAFLLRSGFGARSATWSPAQADAIRSVARQLTDSLVPLIAANPQHGRWAVVLWWGHALGVEELLRSQPGLHYRAATEFLVAADGALSKRMDARHISWILSGVLDEWYGMWAPQVLPTERVASLLHELQKLAPADPATHFLQARWLMQNRDYAAAEPVLMKLVAEAGDARVAFPINGKWMRPPWSSVRRKAKLNLAFLFDLRGSRDSAVKLYSELLAAGDTLDVEARAAGYTYDDIHWVIDSYRRTPYSGLPQEAFRHFRLAAGVPACDPLKR